MVVGPPHVAIPYDLGENMSLTLEEVRTVRFRMARSGAGYRVEDVDTFLDKVEEAFGSFENERDLLRREVNSTNKAAPAPGVDTSALQAKDEELGRKNEELARKDDEINRLRGELERLSSQSQDGPAAFAAAPVDDSRVAELEATNEQLRGELQKVRGELDEIRTQRVSEVAGKAEHITVGTREEASPAVIRLVQLATEQAEQLVSEADTEAKRKLEDATHRAREITTDAQTKAERIESEARVNAEQMTREAKAVADNVQNEAAQRRTELFSDLEREQGELTDRVSALRHFESKYRDNLRGYLHSHLDALDSDLPEPADVPELAQPRSRTPRLDALAQQESSDN